MSKLVQLARLLNSAVLEHSPFSFTDKISSGLCCIFIRTVVHHIHVDEKLSRNNCNCRRRLGGSKGLKIICPALEVAEDVRVVLNQHGKMQGLLYMQTSYNFTIH